MNQQSLELTENKRCLSFSKKNSKKEKPKEIIMVKQNFRDVKNGNSWKFLFTFR